MSAHQTPAPLGSPLATAWLAAWRGRELGAFDAVCAGAATYEGPTVDGILRGPREIAAHADLLWRAFPDLVLEPAAPALAAGVHVAVPWRASGTHRGDLGSLPATRRRVALTGVDYLEAGDGRVIRARGFFDLYAAAVQLGLLPQHGTLSERALLALRGFGVRVRGGA